MREMGVDDQEDCDRRLGLGMSIDTGGLYNSLPVQLDLLPFAPVSRHNTRDVEKAFSSFSREEEGTVNVGTRKKLRLSKDHSSILEESFKQNTTLNAKQKQALAKQLNLRPRQVEVWFQNRRARTKLKQIEIDCELLRRCYDSLTDDNRRLQRELAELRAVKVATAASPLYMQLPTPTLTMCPSCQRVLTSDNTSPLTSLQKPHFHPSNSSATS